MANVPKLSESQLRAVLNCASSFLVIPLLLPSRPETLAAWGCVACGSTAPHRDEVLHGPQCVMAAVDLDLIAPEHREFAEKWLGVWLPDPKPKGA